MKKSTTVSPSDCIRFPKKPLGGRYLLFSWPEYEASGGMINFEGSHNNIKTLASYAGWQHFDTKQGKSGGHECAHIYDSEDDCIHELGFAKSRGICQVVIYPSGEQAP